MTNGGFSVTENFRNTKKMIVKPYKRISYFYGVEKLNFNEKRKPECSSKPRRPTSYTRNIVKK